MSENFRPCLGGQCFKGVLAHIDKLKESNKTAVSDHEALVSHLETRIKDLEAELAYERQRKAEYVRRLEEFDDWLKL